MSEWQSSADRGDAESQFGLGVLYEQGLGHLKQDYKRADYWYRKAAEQENSEAQYRLGLIWSAGGDDFPSDPTEGYKWTVLAASSKGVWGTAAVRLKDQLAKVLTTREQQAGSDRAAAWREARAAKSEPAAAGTPAAATPSISSPVAVAPAAPGGPPAQASAAAPVKSATSGGCPGWPFPTLPCTEQFPALAGAAQPGQTAAAASPPPKASASTPLAGLSEALKRIDCASLKARDADGSVAILGSVPTLEQREKVIQAATRWFPDHRPVINIEIVPPPLCQALVELDKMHTAGLLADGDLVMRLKDNGSRLQRGEPFEIVVQAPGFPVYVRIEYFSLDGQVLHLSAGADRTRQLTATETRVFGRYDNGQEWIAAGTPFGTELIAVIATSAPLNLGARPRAEKALDYLRDLRRATEHSGAGAATPNLLARLLVHTPGR